ncbi:MULTISPECIES: SurA N-terminal domain-containing protein [Rhizobium/Agrobacterium group]|uniref:SurA N-terminal domain-containing protein n=2 Tax=Neorhizobium TaxID=1525371 RepID=A0ABV0M0K7_9HYPH|nr:MULTISPECIES: SurA N-terminal domain-containing protein [Rhizobium/Agrobacterium group]MCC2609219.1 SurA N-terminal domain-containing protein [Neorhizobium petrolearium]WGI69445.1 SurA N-terminal domain-containing protein [Neorhizobium petrolearium]
MFAMTATRRLALAVAVLAASVVVQPVVQQAQAASEIAAVVNRTPITSTDVARRAAFLRLQRQKADTKTAREAMVEEILKRQEVARMRMSVSTDDVDKAFERFAASNKMNAQQMGQILDRAGVGVEHFKNYIAVQMSWPRLVNARYGSGRGRMSSQELVTRMMENKEKPVTTEYFLKQIIFVVPPAKRNAILGKRQKEANASRSKFPGCEQSKQFAATMLDVSVRDLGRILAPELPAEWKPLVEKASGGTTATRVTERGVEFLAICNQRQVSDDFAAEVVFRAEDLTKAQKEGQNPNDKKYLDELRGKAQIEYR